MKVWQAIVLGLVQGASEFLPISSSGHLILVRSLLGLSGEYLLFDVMLHVATLGAVLTCLYEDVLELFRPPFKKLGLLALSAIPAAAVGFACRDIPIFGGGKILGIFFMISACFAFVSHFLAKRKNEKEITGRTVALMSIGQSLAVLPAISRSGTTIMCGLMAGSDRTKVASFSFLMSVPVILGSAILEGVEAVSVGMQVSSLCLASGMIAGFFSGLLAVKLVMRLLKKADFKWFGIYLAVVGVLSVILL